MSGRPTPDVERAARAALFTSTAVAVGLAILAVVFATHIRHLQAAVNCLEHPQAASSTSATVVNGRVTMGKTTRTGCP